MYPIMIQQKLNRVYNNNLLKKWIIEEEEIPQLNIETLKKISENEDKLIKKIYSKKIKDQ
tara:strand:+ start:755 stop:934 length:180 start_codon:yes stop_codon:yes gene_type:complete